MAGASSLRVVGRRDKIDLPDLGLLDFEAKVDTGAYSSALHCHEMTVVERDGSSFLRYKLLDPTHPEYLDKEYETGIFSDTMVRSSNGVEEHRYTIQTSVLIFGQILPIEFTLTDRNEMKYPILLGRKFLKGRFLVDVTKKDLSFREKSKTAKL